MGVKITQLPLKTSAVVGSDLFPIVESSSIGTKRVTASLVRNWAQSGLSTVALTGNYSDLLNKPAQYVLPPADSNTLGGIRVGANLVVGVDGTLSATPGFQQINVSNVALTQTTSALSFFAGSGMTLTADPLTNSITFSSSGGGGEGGGGSGNVGYGNTGTLAVYFNTQTVTGTNITFDGSVFDLDGAYLNAGGAILGKLTATTITSAGDIAINPTGNISVSNKRIINLNTPQSSTDAANKAYVDGQKAFGKILISGQGLVTANSNTDSISFVAGNNVTLTTNPTNRSVTIAVNNTLSFALLPASTTTIGGIVVGAGLSIDGDGVLSNTAIANVSTATTTTAGTVIVGSGLSISAAGTLTALAQALTTATATTLGGVKIGPGILITADGTIQVPTQNLTTATKFLLGGVKIGSGIAAAVDGTINVDVTSLPVATSSSTGVVKPGYGLSVDGTGAMNLGANGNFTVTGNLSVNGVISATSIVTTGTGLTIISGATDLQLQAGGQVTSTAPIQITTTTQTTNPGTGALLVGIWGQNTAGLGVAGSIQTGQDIYVSGVRVGTGNGNQPSNVAFGTGALGNNSSGRYLTAIGSGALLLNTADINTAVGYYAGSALTAGTNNTFVGNNAGSQLITGQNNVAVGTQAQVGVSNGAGNVVAGANILTNASIAVSNNVLLGYNIQNTTAVPGANNIAIGANTLGTTTGSNNIVIGNGAGSGLTSTNAQVIIGAYSGASISSKNFNGYITLADGLGNVRAQWNGSGKLTHAGAMSITDATASADKTTGALVVAGGVGIQGTLNANAIESPSITINGSPVVTFGNLGSSVSSISAGAGIGLTTSTGNVVITNTGTLQLVTNNGYTTTNKIVITDGTSAINSTTGALQVTGGISTQGDFYAKGTVNSFGGLYDNGVRALSAINWTGNNISITATNYLGVYYATLTNLGVTSLTPGTAGNGGGIQGLAVSANTGTVTITNIDTIDSVAARMMAVSGVASISSIAKLTMTNALVITNTATSTGTIYGALTVAGGVGIQGNLNIGGSLLINGYPISTSTVFNGGTITGKMYVQNSGSDAVTKTNNAVAVDGGVYASAFYLNGTALSTSTTWTGGSVANPVTISDGTVPVSTATGALIVTGGIGTRSYVWTRGVKDVAGRPIGQGPTFSAVSSSTQSIANTTWTTVSFNSVNWDTDTAYSAATFRFTPVHPGYYYITAGVRVPTAAGGGISQLCIYKNGAQYRTGHTINNSGTLPGEITVNALVDLQIGGSDFVDIRMYQSSGSAMTIPGGTTSTYFQAVYFRPWTTGPQ